MDSTMGALAHLLKSSLGTGILAMPNAFNNAGLLFGSVMTLIVGVLCTHCVWILVSWEITISSILIEWKVASNCSSTWTCLKSSVDCLFVREMAKTVYFAIEFSITRFNYLTFINSSITTSFFINNKKFIYPFRTKRQGVNYLQTCRLS